MATTNTTATLDGLFKAVYGEKGPINLIPENAILQNLVQFRESERIGKDFEVPVILSQEHGVTYMAPGDGVVTLNDAIASTLKNCVVNGYQIVLRGAIDYEAAAKGSSSKVAFKNATELLVENLMESAAKRLELSMLYGGKGLGQATSSVNSSATVTVVQMTTATWASGIFGGMEGAQINFYNASSGALISSGSDAIFSIDSVNNDDRKLTVSGTGTGITALDIFLAGATDADIYFKGAKAKEMAGLDSIITNTGSLFGIDAATYSLWKGQSFAVGGALTMAKVLSAVSKAVARGLNEEVTVLCNPQTWANLNSDQAALRKYDESYSPNKAENGVEAIVYHGQAGKISVVSHPFVKEGEAFVVPMKRVKRIGAQEMSFTTPGKKDEIFLQLANQNAYELRVYGNQSIFIETPSRCVKLTGIVNA